MRSAKANTTSIECSVNSTEMLRSTTSRLTSAISSWRSRARHAGGRLVHQQQARLVGERDGELDALDVAIGEFAARPVGGLAHADLREQLERALAMQRSGRPPQPVDLAGVRDQRHLHVLDDRHRAEGGGDLEGAADAAPPDVARRKPGDVAALEAGSRRNPAPAGR